LTQHKAARLWKVSQPYLSMMEQGQRPVPARLAKLLAKNDPAFATLLPLEGQERAPADSATALGALGYRGFAYLSAPGALMNPAALVLHALLTSEVPARVTQALPWVLVRFVDLNWDWLLGRVKLANAQNKLGFLVSLAREWAAEQDNLVAQNRLADVEAKLEDARLVKEDTLGRPLTEAERRHLREHRPAAAAHWNLLTNLRKEHLPYGP
jgi:hypothetical protein